MSVSGQRGVRIRTSAAVPTERLPSYSTTWQAVEKPRVCGTVAPSQEPTDNLDTTNGDSVMKRLTEVAAVGTTVIMVTHSLTHARLARRTIDLLDGRVATDGGGPRRCLTIGRSFEQQVPLE